MTAPNLESRTTVIFTRLKYEHHLFCHRIRSVIRGRVIERLRPAFPRYIFVKIVADVMWREVMDIGGGRFVRSYEYGLPVIVPQHEIDDLVQRQQDGVLPNPLLSRFQFGDQVRIVGEYNFAFGNVGVYQYPVAAGRALVLLPWFNGAWSRTEIDERDVERVVKRERRDRGRHRRGGQRRHHTIDLVASACHA